jgi:hypothetical protein
VTDGRRAARLAALVLSAVAVAGCGSTAAGLDAAALGFPVTATGAPLASTTLSTSPDGGIYRNPDHLEVMLVARHNADAVAGALGSASSSWSQLRRFGDLTMVALRLRDDGKVSSDPQLSDLQMASDYAPSGTATGPLRHFYHPTYPLAVVADSSPGDGCSIHLDPGHSGVAILIYPPVNLPTTLVWGRLGDFVLSVPVGGSLPAPAGALHAEACSPPSTAPAS